MNLTDLPPVPASLKDAYGKLIEDVACLTARLGSRHRKHLHCVAGCSSCCRRFSVSPIEAALISERLDFSSVLHCSKRSGDTCGLLIDDLCSIYSDRPLICRTQGLPIGYIDEMNERIDVSVCSLNFSQDYPFTHGDLLFLDPFNRLLAELNKRYCRKASIDITLRIDLG